MSLPGYMSLQMLCAAQCTGEWAGNQLKVNVEKEKTS